MKKFTKYSIGIMWLTLLGIGVGNASAVSDCGDDDMQPINVHSKADTAKKET